MSDKRPPQAVFDIFRLVNEAEDKARASKHSQKGRTRKPNKHSQDTNSEFVGEIDMVKLELRIPQALLEDVLEYAKQKGIGLNRALVELIDKGML